MVNSDLLTLITITLPASVPVSSTSSSHGNEQKNILSTSSSLWRTDFSMLSLFIQPLTVPNSSSSNFLGITLLLLYWKHASLYSCMSLDHVDWWLNQNAGFSWIADLSLEDLHHILTWRTYVMVQAATEFSEEFY